MQRIAQHIAVIGGGLMGRGIALTFAAAQCNVAIQEPDDKARDALLANIETETKRLGKDPELLARISVHAELDATVENADFVTEAAPERLEVKRNIFRQLTRCASRRAILASNTSVIPISRIAEGLETADRIVGTHWWNPAPLIPLVEVVQAEHTSAQTIETTMRLLTAIGKQPAHIRKDLPGFVANRLQHALWREAIAMVAEGICDARTLDACVKNSFGLRLAVLGPLENADMVGLDLTLDIHETIIPELDRHDRPHALLKTMVAERRLGFKSGSGFRTWTEKEIEQLRYDLNQHLLQQNTKGSLR